MDGMRLILAAVFVVFGFFAIGLAPAGAQSFNGVTCDDVRSLSHAEQEYWSARLNLSAEQRHRIYVACYQNYHPQRGHDIGPVANISK